MSTVKQYKWQRQRRTVTNRRRSTGWS